MKSIIVCIGNDLVADDALGHAVHRRLQERALPDDTALHFLGVGGLAVLDLLGGEDLLVVVDAVKMGGTVGEVRVLGWDDLVRQPGHLAITSHDIGLREAIEAGLTLYPERMPKHAVLVGVEGSCFDQLGVPLTPAVAQAVEPVVDRVLQLISEPVEVAGASVPKPPP